MDNGYVGCLSGKIIKTMYLARGWKGCIVRFFLKGYSQSIHKLNLNICQADWQVACSLEVDSKSVVQVKVTKIYYISGFWSSRS